MPDLNGDVVYAVVLEALTRDEALFVVSGVEFELLTDGSIWYCGETTVRAGTSWRTANDPESAIKAALELWGVERR